MMLMFSLAAVLSTASSDAFVTPYSRIRIIHTTGDVTLTSSNDDNNEPVFYDDFGDADFGGSSSTSSMPSQLMSNLSSRMSDTKNLEATYDAKLARNWRRGNWGVRGFGLEKTSASGKPAIVSVVAAPTSSASVDISLPQDKALGEDRKVAVGRSDGSIFIIQLGSEYLTSFVSVSNPDEPASSQWMDAADVEDRSNNDRPKTKFGDGGLVSDDDTASQQQQQPQPFQVIHQFQATEKEEPIHNLVYHDTIEGIQLICTAAGESGAIKIWSLDTSESRSHGEELVAALVDVHSSKVVSLKAMVIPSHNAAADERNVLFSASADGTVALHDLDKKGELIFSCQCIDKVKNFGQVTCADVSNPTAWDGGCDDNDRDVIFLGTSSGYVVGYVAEELMTAAASSENSDEVCPVPSIQFRAHGNDSGAGEAVTAIRCGGHGTIPNTAAPTVGTSRMTSKILLTGGEDGAMKQWEILAQQSTFGVRLEHWPRMSSQRMKRRHHLFKGHHGAVTSISQQSKYDSSKFLTSGNDGSIRVWSATNGEELFTMDGFTSFVSSLACLGRDLLVTDGSGQYVCVHDFSIDDDLEAGYDLDW